MRSILKLVTGVLLASTLLLGCSKDKDNDIDNFDNFLKINDKAYNLSAGFIKNGGTTGWQDNYAVILTLYSNGIVVKTDENNTPYLSGKGHKIDFELFVTNENEFENREYNFAGTLQTGTFYEGFYGININYENHSFDEEVGQIYGGKVNVSKSGSIYTITFDCKSQSGKKITGLYEGALRQFK